MLMAAMERAGAVRLNAREIDALTKVAIATVGEGEHKHDVPAKDFLGQDAAVLAKAIGKHVSAEDRAAVRRDRRDEPVRARRADDAVRAVRPLPRRRRGDRQGEAVRARLPAHGIIHSNNVRNMTKMGRAMDTTLFVKNGPCMASLGLGGEGYLSFSIATPTGEGVTTPLTFTRERRCSLIDDLRILGKP